MFTTEGTYPSVVGGVSTWSDQLVRGLEHLDFHVVEVTGPRPTEPAYDLPANVVAFDSLHLWTPRYGRSSRSATATKRRFESGLERLLRFVHEDHESFAEGLIELARLGEHNDLWPCFERNAVWGLVGDAMEQLMGEPPHLAEVATGISWLRGTLVPLLYLPPPADQAHTTSNGLSAIPAWLASKEHSIPLMLTEHGLYLRERYLSMNGEENPPPVKLVRARFYRVLAELMYADADLVVSVSEFNRAWQIQLGAPVERTRVVYNGVAPSAFPDAGDLPQADPTVAWVGRIDPIKDLETLVSSFEHVKKAAPQARLRLFGPVPRGNEGYRAKVGELVRRLNLASHVRFEGPVKPVHHAYHSSDVVALSSVSEGFPYVAIEAMMCRRPVVATMVGGVGEAVGSFGRMVEPRNPHQLGEALSELLLDGPLRRELGAGARERALSLFTLERMYGSYERLYGELATQPSEVAIS